MSANGDRIAAGHGRGRVGREGEGQKKMREEERETMGERGSS